MWQRDRYPHFKKEGRNGTQILRLIALVRSRSDIYRLMLTDKKYGLSVNWMAAHAMPSLLPQTVNPALNLEQFILLLEVLQDMLNNIERQAQLALRASVLIKSVG